MVSCDMLLYIDFSTISSDDFCAGCANAACLIALYLSLETGIYGNIIAFTVDNLRKNIQKNIQWLIAVYATASYIFSVFFMISTGKKVLYSASLDVKCGCFFLLVLGTGYFVIHSSFYLLNACFQHRLRHAKHKHDHKIMFNMQNT